MNTEIIVQACIDKLELLATEELQREPLKLSLTENSSPSTPALVCPKVNEQTQLSTRLFAT